MPLAVGTRIGSYEITAPIGQGGMGAVFRARDTQLNRDVAIKVMRDPFAADHDRFARFEREAQALAALNHPNIAQVHGLERFASSRAIVMEYVDGVTLADFIRQAATESGGVPVAEALGIARQIADALEAAHEKGIVHRDLKPANILVKPDGTVKILDFGLAKTLDSAATANDLANSPTLSARATEMGLILGTAAYMAPEQARGKPTDKRVDIWAFGVVLFEMLSGRRPFEGETVTDVLASVITKEPAWSRLPFGLPASLVRLIRRCLEKDPRRRLRDIGDARADLEPPPDISALGGAGAAQTSVPRLRRPWAWIVGLAAALAAGAAIGRFAFVPAPARNTAVRFELFVPDGNHAVVSPDGLRVALTTAKGLRLRELDRLEVRDLPGTEGAQSPFWSEDSSSLVYGAQGRLWRVPVAGGAPALICKLPNGDWDQDAGGAWTADGGIVFTDGSSALMRVPAVGGEPIAVLQPEAPDDLHFHHARELPEHRGILFITHRKTAADTLELWADGARRRVLRLEGSVLEHPVYSPTGHILFTRLYSSSFGLWAAPFSLAKLEITGEPFLVAADASGASISRTMRLAYMHRVIIPSNRLTWVDRQGRSIGRIEEPRRFERFPALSPDGTRAAVAELTDDRWDVWTYELGSGTRTRLTSDGFAHNPVWMPDGRSVIYNTMQRGAQPTLKRVAADGSGFLEEIGTGRDATLARDGRVALYWRDGDIFSRRLGDSVEAPFVTGPDWENAPRLSPDGRYVAYLSVDPATFRGGLHVKPFPSGDDSRQVARDASAARWSADGRRLFFSDDTGVHEMDVLTHPQFRVGIARRLFALQRIASTGVRSGFDVSGDGQRFLLIEPDQSSSPQGTVVVLNFTLDR